MGRGGRGDGFVWTCKEVRDDGSHPSSISGAEKVAGLLLSFFTAHIAATGWFLDPTPARGSRPRDAGWAAVGHGRAASQTSHRVGLLIIIVGSEAFSGFLYESTRILCVGFATTGSPYR